MSNTFSLNLLSKTFYMDVVTDDYRQLQLRFQACATSLYLSQVQQEADSPLLSGLSSRDQDTLRSIVRLTVLQPLFEQVSKPIDHANNDL